MKGLYEGKKDGTCEVYLGNRDLVATLCADEQMVTINRWVSVNRAFIKSIQVVGNNERVMLDPLLEEIYDSCKTFNEPHIRNKKNNKSILFIGRIYRKHVNRALKEENAN